MAPYGRPPNAGRGIGFSSQGKFEGPLPPASGVEDPRASWIFDGVDDDVIGDFGLCGQGAAGYELDRADPSSGTPADAIILASSENTARQLSSWCRRTC